MAQENSSWNGKWHPLAERFPMLEEDELRQMAASIGKHGQFVPCRMTPDGVGLDGRNRIAACGLAGIEPSWQVYEGDPIAFVVEVNADRRHLTTGQRAMAVAIGLTEAGRRRNGRFERGSVPDNQGSLNSDWRNQVSHAGLVLDHASELADQVLTGKITLDAAHSQANSARRRQKKLAELRDDLAQLVEADVIDLDEAERRVADEARIAELPADLADRVHDNAISVDEAEAIAAQRDARIAAWASKVEEACDTLTRMAGFPIPDELMAKLDQPIQQYLAKILKSWPIQNNEEEEPVWVQSTP